MRTQDKVIGITGSFGSGKTTVAEMFGALGAYVIDADMICHELMLPGRIVYRKIIRHFGKDIISSDKNIDRGRLADIVFSKTSKLALLNRLVHPAAIREIEGAIRRDKNRRQIVVEGALLVESGFYRKLDALIVVRSKRDKQVSRLMRAKGITRKDIFRRLRSQASVKKKLAFADFIIDNSGSKKETRTQVEKIWDQIHTLKRC
ncbi:MAG: dephospho-CoA kinase [Candidatus Omnitrophota bacterium]